MEIFKQSLESFISVSQSEMDLIISSFDCRKIKIGERIIEKNTFCNNYFFLEKGLLRFVYHDKDIEATSWVIFEGTFFTEIISLKSGKQTNMSLDAIEPSIVLGIEKSRLSELCKKLPSFETYLRLTWEENLYQLLRMKLLQQFNSAKVRYELLIQDKRLSQRIPQKYLASILGITPFSLSRLRRQVKP
jgi:signal-transduction protein with cAMP-binding, CBS, and nucleotidyltransferase domain